MPTKPHPLASTTAATTRATPGTIGWYGKLPSHGDFVGRGLPPAFRREWDGWLQRSLALAALTMGTVVLRARLESFEPWRFVALPADGERWCGIVVPSHDRVGRVFPLTIAQCCDAADDPAAVAVRLAVLAEAAQDGLEALEAAAAAPVANSAALAADPTGASSQRTTAAPSTMETPAAPASLWWPMAATADAAPRVSTWPPDAPLMLDWLGDDSLARDDDVDAG